ncbi:hypothetical protein JCM24511_08012 [Saitozyma sp. JCM 24511]|nr:hypothetical protein JCM24511_08012 [Saitozyma sp. JCM 24511]
MSNDETDSAAQLQTPIYLTEIATSIGHLEALSGLNPDDDQVHTWRTEASATRTGLSELTIATVSESSSRGGIDLEINNAEQLRERMIKLSANLKRAFEARVPEEKRRSYLEWDKGAQELHCAMSHLHTAVLSLSIELDDLRKRSEVAIVTTEHSGGQDRETREVTVCNAGPGDGAVGDRKPVLETSIADGDFDTVPGSSTTQ